MALTAVVLIGGNGSNLQAILDAIAAGQLSLEIKAVISHRKDAYGLERAQKAQIPCLTIAHHDYPNREDFDQHMAAEIESIAPDLIILAGFMRILTPGFIQQFAGKIVNIHPSLLPKYKGLNTHQRALEAGDKYHGASVHMVTEDLDDGPVLGQAQLAISPDDTPEILKAKVQKIEHVLYPLVLQYLTSQQCLVPNTDEYTININHAYLEGFAL